MEILEFLKRFEVYSTLVLAFFITIRVYVIPPCETMPLIVGTDFEVHGRVQGVYFRKFTQEKAKELGLHGWCMNTKQGTVLGYMEGSKAKIDQMKNWLQNTGSPASSISKAEFRNEKELSSGTHKDFTIKK